MEMTEAELDDLAIEECARHHREYERKKASATGGNPIHAAEIRATATSPDDISADLVQAKIDQTIVAQHAGRHLNRADAITEIETQEASYKARLLDDPSCQTALVALRKVRERIQYADLDKAARTAPPSIGVMFSDECAAIEKEQRGEVTRKQRDQAVSAEVMRTYRKHGIVS